MFYELNIKTSERTELQDITGRIEEIISKSCVKSGLCLVFAPHTTAAITINENADPSVTRDILNEINKIVPFADNYRHSEGNSAAHIKSSLFGASETIIISESKLALGVWQSVYFCEFDGPRQRKAYIKIIAD